jgi:hypothetical protein
LFGGGSLRYALPQRQRLRGEEAAKQKGFCLFMA